MIVLIYRCIAVLNLMCNIWCWILIDPGISKETKFLCTGNHSIINVDTVHTAGARCDLLAMWFYRIHSQVDAVAVWWTSSFTGSIHVDSGECKNPDLIEVQIHEDEDQATSKHQWWRTEVLKVEAKAHDEVNIAGMRRVIVVMMTLILSTIVPFIYV